MQRRCIYIPRSGNSCCWALPDQCVWDAPQNLQSKFALELLYSPYFRTNGMDSSYYAHFFRDSLGVADCTWKDCLDELRALKFSSCSDSDIITGIYKSLDGARPNIVANGLLV